MSAGLIYGQFVLALSVVGSGGDSKSSHSFLFSYSGEPQMRPASCGHAILGGVPDHFRGNLLQRGLDLKCTCQATCRRSRFNLTA